VEKSVENRIDCERNFNKRFIWVNFSKGMVFESAVVAALNE